jgi:hypothetical protein
MRNCCSVSGLAVAKKWSSNPAALHLGSHSIRSASPRRKSGGGERYESSSVSRGLFDWDVVLSEVWLGAVRLVQ